MSKTEQLIQSSFENGQKLSEYGFTQAGGHRYNYRQYVIGFNKLAKAANVHTFDSNPLVQTLKEQTETLRVQYLAKVEDWAKADFIRIEKLSNTPHPIWANFVKPDSEMGFTERNGRKYRNQDYAGQKEYNKACDRRHAAQNIVKAGIESYLMKEAKSAEEHYQNSILKLAARIEKKGLDKKNLSIKTAHIGVNIETVFTDGIQIVKAWTIIASGMVQRPHYRYLVK